MSKQRQELRTEMKTVVSRLDVRWIQAASHDLCKRLSVLFDTEFSNARHVLAWASFFPGEVDLSSFIGDQVGKRTVYLPRVLEDRKMTFIPIEEDWMTNWEAGAFGVPGPLSEEASAYEPSKAGETIVIVPGLAFDPQGHRVGRGKGYYNSFLRGPMKNLIKVGVCWSLQFISNVPSDSEHVLMDWVVHERDAVKVVR